MRSRILIGLIAGTIGGFLGWMLQEMRIDYTAILRQEIDFGRVSDLSQAEMFRALALFVGGLIGLFLGSVDGIVVGNTRKIVQGMLLGALCGVLFGSIGLYLGNYAYAWLGGSNNLRGQDASIFAFSRQVIARSFGWALMGLGLGIGSAVSTKSTKRIWHGAIGGFLGGFLGGFIFDLLAMGTNPAQQALGSSGGIRDVGGPSRAVGFTAIGALTGFFIGLVEELLKQAWVKVLAGRNEGKDFILSKPMNILGRDERCDVPLYGDAGVFAQHAAIRADGNRHVLIDAGAPGGTVVNGQQVAPGGELLLRDGDMIQIGSHRILFREKATASKFAREPVDVPKSRSAGPSNVPMPSHMCPFCGAPKKPDGSCLCTVAGSPGTTPVGSAGGMVGATSPGFDPNAALGSPMGAGTTPGTLNAPYRGMTPRGGSDMARLVGVEGPYTGQVFLITAPNMLVGREPDKDVVLTADPTISRSHARITNENGDIVVYDSNSANGTFVNNLRVSMQVLAPGDIVQFGASKFRYE